eukprot:1625756-Amphidinium_carterae.1
MPSQVTSSADGGMGGSFTNMLMNKMSQSAEDGTMPLLSCCCKADAATGNFFVPEGMMTVIRLHLSVGDFEARWGSFPPTLSGRPKLATPEKEEKLVPPEKRTMLWETSLATTGDGASNGNGDKLLLRCRKLPHIDRN